MSDAVKIALIGGLIGLVGTVVTSAISNADKVAQFLDWCCSKTIKPEPNPPEPGVEPPRGSVILFSSEPTLEAAQTDIKKAHAKGFTQGIILFKYNRYRGALLFPTYEDAEAKLSGVQASLDASAYPRDLSSWCPKPQGGSAGFWTCPNNNVF
jgi:hypothetical protein